MPAKAKGRFIDPMLLLRTDSLPNDGDRWEYQLKFDGYRAIAFKTGGKIHLRSRNDNDFSVRYSERRQGSGEAAGRDGHRWRGDCAR